MGNAICGKRITQFLDNERSSSCADALARYKASTSLQDRLYAANHNVGTVKECFFYDPYRNSTVLTSAWASTSDGYSWTVRSQGQREDATTNTIDSRNRVYGLGVGRWLQADNIGGYVDGANRYQFVKGNPESFSDALGTFASSVHRDITVQAARLAALKISAGDINDLAEADVETDRDLGNTTFDPNMHAQSLGFIGKAKGIMDDIKKLSEGEKVPTTDGRTLSACPDKWKMLGQLLHILQDAYSHTDWIDGNQLVIVLSCAPIMVPPDDIDFLIRKDRKSDEEEAFYRGADRIDPA